MMFHTNWNMLFLNASSAPEQPDVLSLHIRVVGHWTARLYEYFEAEQKRLECTMQGEKCEVTVKVLTSFNCTFL